MVIIRYRRTFSILSGIAAMVAVSIVLASAIQKTRMATQRMTDT
jgi:hypothetical protein